ncbi:MAG: hypothetical protein JW929_09885 [Anaerolineales bacterium]|nr:hypothetical protein [Anaerolineales bacterium]
MGKKRRFGIFQVIADCPHCGNPAPFNGPLRRLACPSCRKEIAIAPRTWHDLLGEYLNGYADLEPGGGNTSTVMGELTLKCKSVKLPPPDPACPTCQTNWVLSGIPDGTDGVITCKQCGRTSPTFPPPDWLREGVPAAKQIFFAERESEGRPGQAADEAAQSRKPIALACPQCGGNLQVTAQDARIVRCKYCKADVFLPDALWGALHPAKDAKFWLVRFG